ncbi:MAG TPA: twin-arginine translocase TatA/TatE family subunit [Terriglobales bacterium]|nr:twin-arginine translocase TatA/TatE family subunit [Terriglobales bacterium]
MAKHQQCASAPARLAAAGCATLTLGKAAPDWQSTGGLMGEGLFQPMHLLLILVIALLLFGPKRLPEIGKGIGDGIRALKEGMKEQNAKAEPKQEDKTDTKPETKA